MCDLSNRGDELAAEPGAARRLLDKNVLDVKAVTSLPGRVVVEKQREAHRLLIDFREQNFEASMRAETVPPHIGLGYLHVLERLFLIRRQRADEVNDPCR